MESEKDEISRALLRHIQKLRYFFQYYTSEAQMTQDEYWAFIRDSKIEDSSQSNIATDINLVFMRVNWREFGQTDEEFDEEV